MKAIATGRSIGDDPQLRETECALAISPVPRIERQPAPAGTSGLERERPGRDSGYDEDPVTDALSIGWALAIALAVALAVFTSGG